MAASLITRSLKSTTKFVSARPIVARAFSAKVHKGLGPNVGKPTHTGQLYEPDDYRNIRFVDKDKLVNTQWAIDLIDKDPVVVVDAGHVWSHSCGPLGHPKVYINLDKPKIGICGYSGRKFIQKKYYKESEHGLSISHDEYLEQMKGDSR